jgi:hypothetical protein
VPGARRERLGSKVRWGLWALPVLPARLDPSDHLEHLGPKVPSVRWDLRVFRAQTALRGPRVHRDLEAKSDLRGL